MSTYRVPLIALEAMLAGAGDVRIAIAGGWISVYSGVDGCQRLRRVRFYDPDLG